MRSVAVEGWGLHTGAYARVALVARGGPVALRAGGVEVRVGDLEVSSTARATTVEAAEGRLRVHTVEHAMAALGGLGIGDGVALVVDGPEMPLLDGGALAWCEALDRLGLAAAGPRLRVTRSAVVEVGASRYELAPADDVDVEVRFVVDDLRLEPCARWTGDPGDFRARIAPARTFALARDLDELLRLGLGQRVDPASVVLVGPGTVHHVGRPFCADEPARHKLLDLIGDLYLRGGPPLGRVKAIRPGHGATARVIARALNEGVLAPLGQ